MPLPKIGDQIIFDEYGVSDYMAESAMTFHRLFQGSQPIALSTPSMRKEVSMTKEIAKKDVTADLLATRIEEAGYEVELDEDGDVSIQKTGFNTRLEVIEEYSSLRLRAAIVLHSSTKNQDAEALVSEINKRFFLPRFVYHRWEDGDIAIIANHVVLFPFGLNMPNLLFGLRRFLEGVAGAKKDFVEDTAFDPDFVGPNVALPAPEKMQ